MASIICQALEWGGGRGSKGGKKSKLGIDGVKVKLAPLTEEQKAVKRAKKAVGPDR